MTHMSLQGVAWLGATVSGVGVIVSVIYVSIQISHNTRPERASAFQHQGLDSILWRLPTAQQIWCKWLKLSGKSPHSGPAYSD